MSAVIASACAWCPIIPCMKRTSAAVYEGGFCAGARTGEVSPIAKTASMYLDNIVM